MALLWSLRLSVEAGPPGKRLHHQLMVHRNYNKLLRPMGSHAGRLSVKLGMRLSQLLDVDEKNQIMTTNVWLRHEWYDTRLEWSPEEYGDVKMMHIPSKDLWRPDIVLYNNADGEFVVTLMTKATVHFDGRIVWEPPAIYKSYCPIDVEFFPFDMQQCFMKFGSWTYDGNQVDLQHFCMEKGITTATGEVVIKRGIDLKDYYPNVEWDIINVTARRKEKFYGCCIEPYPDIMFNVTLRRRTLFYTLNLIMPCISISCLTVLVFYLPSDSGEKITLSISILLALTVFFLLLSDINPPTSLVVPLIGKYLMFTMIVVAMSIFMTVFTLHMNYRAPTTHKMRPWVRRIFTEILPKILLLKRPQSRCKSQVAVRTCSGVEVRETYTVARHWSRFKNMPAPSTANRLRRLRHHRPHTLHIDDQDMATAQSTASRHAHEIHEVIEGVKYIANRMQDEDERAEEVRDWKFVAMVLDRFFLYIFTSTCLAGTLCIFLYAPSLYDHRIPMEGSNEIGNTTCIY
ncbi:acetylcholine receptor subunit alpha-like 1 [Octopus vulgaris]|uniref:Acetylcholine receptor subunit alpha-like 1 n=2 Tax=Octopus TaxID=6643 RepID=A0AA36FB27_OCTVU|nr:acetylcholine receptor subunit alpha-like 1 [Octopus vulgaris]